MTTRTKKITALKFWVRIVVETDSNGFYSYTPSLKGIHMGGDTPEEALENAKEAAQLYLKSMLKHGDPIPIDILEPTTDQKVSKSKEVLVSRVVEVIVKI
jgi:predicted RNase H-like HicB family nuclease